MSCTGADACCVDSSEWEIRRTNGLPTAATSPTRVNLQSVYAQVRIWDAKTKKAHELSDPMFSSFSPTWDPNGKYIYYLSDRSINPYLDRAEARFIVNNATVPVRAGAAGRQLRFRSRHAATSIRRSPRRRRTKRPRKRRMRRKGAKATESKTPKSEEKVEPIRIDFDGLAERLVQVPCPPGNYLGLRAMEGKLHWLPDLRIAE